VALGVAAACGLFWAVGAWRTGSAPAPAGEGADEPAWFVDATERLGLDFVHDAGPTGTYFLPQITGSGAALFDYDGDGRLDLLLLQGGGPDSPARNRLYHQEEDGHFRDVSAGSGLDFAGFCTGVAVGDVNNDGLPDVLIALYGGVRLFLNRGAGRFEDVTRRSGLQTSRWATSAAFLDYDRDGRLDLVVAHYIEYDASHQCRDLRRERDYCRPQVFPDCVTQLYRNVGRGEDVRFEDVTTRSGLGSRPGPGLGVICADFDGDGWPDILIANDGKANHLWINQHDGTFKEEAVERGLAFDGQSMARANMGIAAGDVDGNGLFDVFITHLTEEKHTLWLQERRGFFTDGTGVTRAAPADGRGTGFGTVMADFNHDGALDIAVANGRVARQPQARSGGGSFWADYAENNQLLANDGRGHFREVSRSNPALCRVAGVWRGLAVGDVNGDGAPDLLVTAVGGPARLLLNVAPARGHWLIARAFDPGLHRDAYGAEVVVEAAGRRQLRWVNPGSSYQCSNDPRTHFGLGKADRYDRIEVRWPDGSAETFPGGRADRVVTLDKGKGKRVPR
jgi:hypothetical protein